MPTIGFVGNCPQCGSRRMEGEKRWAEQRGECPDCGLFYEEGWLNHVAQAYALSTAKNAQRVGRTARARLREESWLLRGPMALRIAFIRKDESSRGHFHVINTWFSVPLRTVSRPTDMRVVRFTEEEEAAFDENDWFLRDGDFC